MFNLQDAVESAQAVVRETPSDKQAFVRKQNQKILQFASDVKRYSSLRLKARAMEAKINASNKSDMEKAQLIADYQAKQLELMTKIINKAQKAGIAV